MRQLSFPEGNFGGAGTDEPVLPVMGVSQCGACETACQGVANTWQAEQARCDQVAQSAGDARTQGDAARHEAGLDQHPLADGMAFTLVGVEYVVGSAGEGLVLENFHTFEGMHYDRTLMAWWERFDAGWDQLKQKYGDSFYQMWKLYLQGCAGAFRAERLRVWQFVFSKGGFPGGYAYGHNYPLD